MWYVLVWDECVGCWVCDMVGDVCVVWFVVGVYCLVVWVGFW